ncbi:glutamate racemase [Pseudomonas sp. S30_BP2TU TE3576]|uniref:glutamate racemase n=1 Tax=Pseudomonas sp. S30_BP2TU TE3576 TaxID=3349329 RepID=UPI003D1C85BB
MIGVFDSGSGGLTVFRALREAFPNQRFVYYGDHGNAPYGNRDADTIYEFTVSSLERLFELGCSLIVVACNTAAATGLRRLQQTWLPTRYPDKRVIGVIVPMVEAMTGVPWSAESDSGLQNHGKKTVAVFATRYTVESRVFVEETAKRAPNVNLVQQACPSLVRLIEANAPVRDLRRAVRRYVTLLMRRLGDERLDGVFIARLHPLSVDRRSVCGGHPKRCRDFLSTKSDGKQSCWLPSTSSRIRMWSRARRHILYIDQSGTYNKARVAIFGRRQHAV